MVKKNYKSFNFNDLKKCMQWFGYSAGEVIEIIEKREKLNQATLRFYLIIFMNSRNIKKAKALGTPDSAKNYKGKIIKRKKTGEGDDLYAISLGGKELRDLYYQIPQAIKNVSYGKLRLRMKELYQRNMKKHGKRIRHTYKLLSIDSSLFKRHALKKK